MRLVNWPAGVPAPGMNGKGSNDVKVYRSRDLRKALAPRLTQYHREFANPDQDPESIELKSFAFERWTEGCGFFSSLSS